MKKFMITAVMAAMLITTAAEYGSVVNVMAAASSTTKKAEKKTTKTTGNKENKEDPISEQIPYRVFFNENFLFAGRPYNFLSTLQTFRSYVYKPFVSSSTSDNCVYTAPARPLSWSSWIFFWRACQAAVNSAVSL